MKKSIFTLGLLSALLVGSYNSEAQSSIWHSTSTIQMPAGLTQRVFPTQFDLFTLDINPIKNALSQAGSSFNEGVTITLPMGDEWVNLVVWRDDVLPKELQELYPEIRSYIAVVPNDHSITAKIDINTMGFNAMIFNPKKGTFVIDPFSTSYTNYYISYNYNDLDKAIYRKGGCHADEYSKSIADLTGSDILTPSDNFDNIDNLKPLASLGEYKRTYKMGISCTGAWAQMISGGSPSMTGVISAITTIVNRANGIFQRELGVKMELIPELSSILYLAPEVDPFDCKDETHECLLSENQTLFNSKFVSSNYDIGHIFSTVGGGLANLNAVCNDPVKAMGSSGVTSTSEIFVFVHEVGHQLGSSHIFNSNAESCAGQGTEATAYEPGSGNTILSYNGLCAPDNIPATNVLMYSHASQNMIASHLLGDIGSKCGKFVENFKSIKAPAIDAFYNIPKNTPFEFMAKEAVYGEPSKPQVLYSWEQSDLGEFGKAESGSATAPEGPHFMVNDPTENRDRQFPYYENILNGDYNKKPGLRLSSSARVSTFKLGVRSYFEGYGTFNVTNDKVSVFNATAEEFRVTSPNAPKTYLPGDIINIKWNVARSNNDTVDAKFVEIHMSLDGAKTFPYVVATSVPNNGSYDLKAPNAKGEKVHFKVKGQNNVFFDISKVGVTILGDPLSSGMANNFTNNIKVYPNPTADVINIKADIKDQKSPLLVSLTNIQGQIVYSTEMINTASINVADLPKGMYMLQVLDRENLQVKNEKVIVK